MLYGPFLWQWCELLEVLEATSGEDELRFAIRGYGSFILRIGDFFLFAGTIFAV